MQDEIEQDGVSRTGANTEARHEVGSETNNMPEIKNEAPKLSKMRGITIGICLGTLILLQAINISMLTTISSAIARDLDAYSEVSWLASSYLISSSSLTPVGGRLCKIFSSASCILFASIMLSIGAAITAVSPTLPWFLVGRAVAGVGAAFVFGVATVFVIELASKKRRGLFVGLVNSGYTVGIASGAVIAGALEASIGWRSIFWLQIPFAILAGLGIFFFAPKSQSDIENENQSTWDGFKRIDYLGVVTMTTTLVLLLYSLSADKVHLWALITCIITLGAFLFTEALLAREPIIPIEVMRSRAIAFTCLSTLGFMMSRWTVLFYTPVFQIAVRGWAPTAAGLILVPTNAGFAFGGLTVGLFHIRRTGSYYWPTIISFILFAGCMLVFSQISTAHPKAGLYIATAFVNGIITGATLNYGYAHLLHISHPKQHSIVTSLVAMFRGFAGSFGSSIGGGIFRRTLKANLEVGFEGQEFEGKDKLIRQLLGSPVLARSLHGEQREIAKYSYAAATSTLFLTACALVLGVCILQACAGWIAAANDDEDETRPLLQNEE